MSSLPPVTRSGLAARVRGAAGRRRYRWAALLGVLAIAVTFGIRASLERLDSLDEHVPSGPATAAAMALLVLGQGVLGLGWRRLVPAIDDPVASMFVFHAAQPGKYLPLGVGHAAGQVVLAREVGLPFRPALAAWASQTLLIVAGGVTTGVLITLQSDLGALRWVGLAAPLAAVLAWRPTLAAVVRLGRRVSTRLPDPSDVPAQRGLLDALATSIVFFLLHGAAFAILLGSDGPWTEQLGLVGAYAVAAGLSTATPLPAGLGVREALLVALCAPATGAVLAAAIVLRVAVFAVEVSLLGAFGLAVTARRRSQRVGLAGAALSPEQGPPPS